MFNDFLCALLNDCNHDDERREGGEEKKIDYESK